MKLYEVVFWGSTGEQPNKDTIYLVRAPDFNAAVEEIRNNVPPLVKNGQHPSLPHVVYEIGQDLSLSQEDHPRILRGPYIESAYNRGWKSWLRKIENAQYTQEWEESNS